MRKQPSGPPPEVRPVPNKNSITQVREYQLITPLFGGGVTPGECDPVTAIRGTEIRGQLRFWWRATRGGNFKDLAEMKNAEDKLWGAPYKKGDQGLSQGETVQIMVEVTKQGTRLEPFRVEENRRGENQVRPNRESGVHPYAAFPLQPNQDDLKQQNPPIKALQDNIAFSLTISFPSAQRAEIEAALWAWETFGGIGARTRRGFGAFRSIVIKENDQVLPIDLPLATQEDVKRWLQKNLERHVTSGSWPANVPHLRSQVIEGEHFKCVRRNNSRDAFAIWEYLIESLKNFRQMRRQSTIQDAKHPGRSMWPEPSAIRQLTEQSHPRHANPIPNPAVNKFPRAVFGLPIIFHFKDRGEPEETSLEGAAQDFERLASPLILRPVSCRNNEFLGIALLLEGPRTTPGGLQLTEKNGSQHPVSTTLTRAEASQIPPLNGKTDVLQAFLNYLV